MPDDAAPPPSDELQIRELRPDEAAALQAFYNNLSCEARRLFRPLGWSATLESTQALCTDMAAGKRYDLVLDAAGQIVGWAFIASLDRDEADFGIGINSELTGKGHGRRLIQAVIDRARKLGKRSIRLCHVHDNARAHHLYSSFGFVATGTHRGDDGLDYIDMKLTL